MIPNLLNTVLGLGVVYAAIFPSSIATHRVLDLALAAGATIVLAVWSRRSDVMTWQSTATIAAGVWLGFLLLLERFVHVSGVVTFWVVLWMGLVSATFSLWAALYRPDAAAR